MFRTRSCLPLLLAAACLAVAAGLLRHDLRQLALLRNTFVLATGTCAISLPLGTVLAFLLVRTDVPGRRLVLALIGGLLMLPLYLQAAGWDAGFGQLGWCSLVRGAAATPLLQGGTAAVWIHALAAVPWVVLLVGAALLGVEPELEEDALLAGSTWQVFRHVTLPRMFGGVAVAAGWVALSVCGEMTVTDLFLVRTYAEELYTGFALGDTLAAAWRAAVPGILVQASLLLVAIASLLRVAPTLATPLRPARTYRLRTARLPAALAILVFGVLAAGVPLANLVAKAGLVVQQSGGVRWRHWSLEHAGTMIGASLSAFRHEFAWSLVIAGLAATGAMLVATGLAWRARHRAWRTLAALTLAAGGLAVPGPLISLGIIWGLDRSQPAILMWLYDRTIAAPVLATAIRILPLAMLGCWYVLGSVADDALDCAACDGAGAWSRFWRVAWPQRRAGLAAVWLAVLAIASGELAGSILVMPPGVTTVPIRVFGLIHAGVDDQVAGLCLVIFGSVAAAVAATAWLIGRHQRGAADNR